jgi:quinohemoprotein amine dehydrogenase
VSMGLTRNWTLLGAALLLGLGWRSAGAAAAASDRTPAAASGVELVRAYCSGCHQEQAGSFARISAIRKTPEGWVMTLFRMRQVHGLVLDEGVRDSLVRYLSETQGLAPSESAAGRFALERRPNAQDLDLGAEVGVMCGRCHSLARVALQRRDADEWRKLNHTHVGQWPSLEYQQGGRDRAWWDIANGKLPEQLGALFPFESTAWTEWKARPARDLSGGWVVVGHVPGGKDFYGSARIERSADGDYSAHYELADVAGIALKGESKAIVYTGYEWRGRAELGARSLREVYAVSEDGNRISGRWFDADHAEDGGEWTAIRESGTAQVLAILPRSVRAGSAGTVIVVGNGLGTAVTATAGAATTGKGVHGAEATGTVAHGAAGAASISFGEGIVATNVERDAHSVRALVSVAANAAPGLRDVSTGGATGQLAVYRQIDQIDVLPSYGIARLGGGRIAPVTAQFEAMASTRLPSGELLALGPVAAEWSSIPFDAEAKRTEDEKFAGHFDARGCFSPSSAGPNPAREYSGDNVGNLTVLAHAREGERGVEGRAHLVVTVQRWNTPPIY